MSVESVTPESPPEKSPHSNTVQDGKEKLCSSMQNGQHHVTFADNSNRTNVSYLDTAPTTPLLSDRLSDNSEDDTDASEELSIDSPTRSLVLLKDDGSDESSFRIALQVFFPYIVAGFGMVGAGAVLEIVKVCFILVTIIL